jgi:myosin heavy subunit
MLSILAIIAMGVAAASSYFLTQARDKLQVNERDLQLALSENKDLQSRLDDAVQTRTRAEEDLKRVRSELKQAQEELARTVEEKQTLTRSIDDREQEISRLTKELEQTRSEGGQVRQQLSDLQSERDTMERQLADLERAKSDLEAKVTELSERPTVELEKVRVTSDEAAAAVSAVALPTTAAVAGTLEDGRVLVIDREYDFIVMDRGKNHGVAVGQEFHIVRGEEVLGTVKVEKVYDVISAAALLPGAKEDAIRAGPEDGDTVKAL